MTNEQLAATFTCCRCERERPVSLATKPRPDLCLVCGSWRAFKGDYDEFEKRFIARKEGEAKGLKRCAKCHQFHRPEDMNHSYCKVCRQVNERGWRKEKAERAGAVYVPLADRIASAKAARLAREASRAEAERTRLREKPWTAPHLTQAEAWRMRYRMDEQFQIAQRLRRQIKKKARRDGVADLLRSTIKRDGKSPTIQRLLGYSSAELKHHLERQFTQGMTWEAFKQGHIHIDHIVPQKDFDLSKDDEWRSCWALPNLRPMWAADNLKKSGRRVVLL